MNLRNITIPAAGRPNIAIRIIVIKLYTMCKSNNELNMNSARSPTIVFTNNAANIFPSLNIM